MIGAWLADRDHPDQQHRRQAVAVDGAPGEVPGFAPLLADLDLADVVVTADALQTHADATEFLVTGKQSHYGFPHATSSLRSQSDGGSSRAQSESCSRRPGPA